MFPVDPPDEVDAVRRKFCLKNVISRLTRAGLETKLFLSVQQDEVYCKVRATCVPSEAGSLKQLPPTSSPPSYARLQAEADRVNYKLELDENATRARALQPTSWRRPLNIVDVKGVSPLRPYQHIYARVRVACACAPPPPRIHCVVSSRAGCAAQYDVASHLQPLYKKHPPFGGPPRPRTRTAPHRFRSYE